MYSLGVCYAHGFGVEQNIQTAIEFYEKAAKSGNINSMYNLGIIHQNESDCFIDFPKSFYYFNLAAQNGDSESMLYCFKFCSKGIGKERNFNDSIKYLLQSAETDYEDAFIPFGLILLDGIFIEKDEQKAVYYFKKSFIKSNIEGKFWFGKSLIEGLGIRKSFYQGLELIVQTTEVDLFLSQLYISTVQPFRSKFK